MNLRRQILPLFVILTWSFHLTAAPVAPVVPCFLSLQEVNETHMDKISNQYALTMNSLESILWHNIKLPKIEPDIQALDFDSTRDHKSNKKIAIAASRIQGILEFSKDSIDIDSEMRKQTKTFSIVGDSKISTFLEKHQQKLNNIKMAKRVETKSDLLYQTFWLSVNIFITTTLPFNMEGKAAFLGMALLAAHPLNTLLKPLEWDWHYEKNLKNLKDFLENAPSGNISLLSRNFSVTKKGFNKFQTYNSQTKLDELAKDLHQEEFSHSPTLLLSILRAFQRLGKIEKQWVGLDLVLEKKEDGQSELHFVTRYSEKMPVFPKSLPEKKKEKLEGLKPVYIPGES